MFHDRKDGLGTAQPGQSVSDHREAPDSITEFYDRHPYPPPASDLDGYRFRWRRPGRRNAEFHLLFPTQPFREDLDVLVAGCGTSQAARHALRWPSGRVVAIDVSETSLRHTEELRRRYNLENLEILHLPIERVEEVGRSFDLIVCTGVLHHLADPDVGLSALRAVLRPAGAMHIMVYARYGRTGVSMMQEYSRRLGIGTSEQEVRDLAHTVAEVSRDHPLDPLLRETPDFQHADALADALLNPRDRTYSVPELFDYLDRNGVTLGRWYRQAPYRPQCGAVATTPHAALLAALPEPEQYAAVELFRGSMTRHSFVAYRDDCPPGTGRLDLDGESWENAVPIRLPNTISVQERLPAGAAAVLINRSHTYPDLIVPISGSERRLYAAIDGKRTITQAAATAGLGGSTQRKADRAFFQRLWWYDQIVLDASRSSHTPPPQQ